MAAALVIPVLAVGTLALALAKMASPPPPTTPSWQLIGPQPSLEPIHTLPVSDHLTGKDRLGAHHLAAHFGPGTMYFTPEVTSFLARL